MMPQKPLPLAILAALATGESHAYAIQQQMITDVKGQMVVYGRAVYRELPRLIERHLIEPVAGTRPVRYRLTKQGRLTLADERERALNIYRLIQSRL